MKREVLILNVVCFALALGFIAFALYNLLTADSFGSFLTIDNLFTTAFCLLMALVFIIVPASWLVQTGVIPIPFMSRAPVQSDEGGQPSLPAAHANSSTAALPAARANAARTAAAALPESREIQKDAKGRPIPADVQRMVAEMNKSEQKTS